ncbi:hypothetical protein EDD85DRAFT_787920 [Armillaria nabsnona]|nr:hypothetical protein EDD85DRAFT_787920 [Armillaria nabsnona]
MNGHAAGRKEASAFRTRTTNHVEPSHSKPSFAGVLFEKRPSEAHAGARAQSKTRFSWNKRDNEEKAFITKICTHGLGLERKIVVSRGRVSGGDGRSVRVRRKVKTKWAGRRIWLRSASLERSPQVDCIKVYLEVVPFPRTLWLWSEWPGPEEGPLLPPDSSCRPGEHYTTIASFTEMDKDDFAGKIWKEKLLFGSRTCEIKDPMAVY